MQSQIVHGSVFISQIKVDKSYFPFFVNLLKPRLERLVLANLGKLILKKKFDPSSPQIFFSTFFWIVLKLLLVYLKENGNFYAVVICNLDSSEAIKSFIERYMKETNETIKLK